MIAYHASRDELAEGTVLEPRFIKDEFLYQFRVVESALEEGLQTLKAVLLADHLIARGKARALTFALKEVVLERVRAREFPQRLSRVDAVFLSPTIEDATAFQRLVDNDRPHLYECVVDGDGGDFVGDLLLVASVDIFAPMQQQLDELARRARAYWNGDRHADPILEVLAPQGSVRITARA